MTDYRLRNQDLLYADRRRRPVGWREFAIFGSIVLTVTAGVVGYLADRFNAAAAGFNPASDLVAQQKLAPERPPASARLETPRNSRFGS
jgi:hypothetical protein